MFRYLVDSLGNYVFFVPLVLVLTPALWSTAGVTGYLMSAVPISLIGARLYTAFLKRVWYPRWGITF